MKENKGFFEGLKDAFSNAHVKKRLVSALISVAVIIAVILVNIGATALAERYPIALDLTANEDYTLTTMEAEHEEFIRSITYPVSITMCFGSSDIAGGVYDTYMQNSYMYSDSTGKYYNQMKTLTEQYTKLNSKITVSYSSPLETPFSAITGKYPDETFAYGDILVECSFKNSEGQDISRHRIINVDDIYKVEDESGYAAYGYGNYTVTGSNLEPSVTQALYAVTNEKSTMGTVFTGHNCDPAESLIDLLEKNNYEFDTVSDLFTESFDEESEFLIVSCPTSDFTNEEIAAIQNYLKADDEHRQKTLVYIPDLTSSLPNFEEFLEEWDITVHDADVYGIDDSRYYKNLGEAYGPYYMFADVSEDGSSYAPDTDENARFLPAQYRAVTVTRDGEEDDTIASLLNFPSTAVGIPITETGAESSWTPEQADLTGELQAVCVAVDYESTPTSIDEESYYLVSNLLCVTSKSFFSSSALTSSAYANADYTVSLFNQLASIDSSDVKQVTFTTKEIVTDDFSDEISDSNMPGLVRIVFLVLVPLATAVIGITVAVRRKRR